MQGWKEIRGTTQYGISTIQTQSKQKTSKSDITFRTTWGWGLLPFYSEYVLPLFLNYLIVSSHNLTFHDGVFNNHLTELLKYLLIRSHSQDKPAQAHCRAQA